MHCGSSPSCRSWRRLLVVGSLTELGVCIPRMSNFVYSCARLACIIYILLSFWLKTHNLPDFVKKRLIKLVKFIQKVFSFKFSN